MAGRNSRGNSGANPRSANGSKRRKIKRKWRSIGAPCALCGKPIDYTLGMVTDPITGRRRQHPMSFVVDEIVPVSQGGDPLDFANTQPAHWICNALAGDKRGTKGAPVSAKAKGIARTPRPESATLALPQPWDM